LARWDDAMHDELAGIEKRGKFKRWSMGGSKMDVLKCFFRIKSRGNHSVVMI
jgi:hypothetical protein